MSAIVQPHTSKLVHMANWSEKNHLRFWNNAPSFGDGSIRRLNIYILLNQHNDAFSAKFKQFTNVSTNICCIHQSQIDYSYHKSLFKINIGTSVKNIDNRNEGRAINIRNPQKYLIGEITRIRQTSRSEFLNHHLGS